MKITHKIFYIFATLVVGVILVWFITGILNINNVYGKKMFVYQKDKICIECLDGTRKGVCPRLMRPYGENDLVVYPFAQENKDLGDAKIDQSDYSDSNIIKNGSCEEHHSDKDFINRFSSIPIPNKSLSDSLDVAGDYIVDFPVLIIYSLMALFTND